MLNIKSITKNNEKKFYVDVTFKNDLNVYTRKTYKEKDFEGRIYSFIFFRCKSIIQSFNNGSCKSSSFV